MVYRIYTEDKNREEIVKIVSSYFEGFTLIPAIGYYKGLPEKSLIIEIAIEEGEEETWKITAIEQDIINSNGQDCVLTIEENSKWNLHFKE